MCFSKALCQFKGQWFYDGRCLRETTSTQAQIFTDGAFMYCYNGAWMYPGTVWDQPNELVQAVNIIANTQDKIKDGTK